MTNKLTVALVSGVSMLAFAGAVAAQDKDLSQADARAEETGARFTWEGSLEIGSEAVFESTVPGNEIRDTYAIGEVAGELALGGGVAIFTGLTWESVTPPVADRSFEDMGLYFHELGVKFDAANGTFFLGKVHPVFGSAWDSTAGFFGGSLAEDYELTEKIGALADVDLGAAGTLSFGIFYDDDTVLSESAGFNRGRNTTAAGGAGNTGEFNNAAIQWSNQWDATYAHIGVRHLSAGAGDVSDETGIVAGIGHSFTPTGLPLDLFAEVASLDGYGGSADDATYVTLNAAYAIGKTTISGTYARRDISSAGVTDLASIAVEYPLTDNLLMGGALAHVDDNGVKDKVVGLNLVYSFGG
ncbi:porin [Seohaeicola saemankumensis]|nr:porin [Seohaeicola saemankumensis]MCA0871648.1 porin [Seohaeicola saemankumensis]